MEKRNFFLILLLAVMSLLVLTGCKEQPPEEPEPVQIEYQILWNLNKTASGGGTAIRKPDADGVFSLEMFFQGQALTVKAADRATANAVDKYFMMAVALDENGFVTQVVAPDRMDSQLLSDGFYVQSVENGLVTLNSSYRFDGMEGSFFLKEDTKIYDMSGASGEPGTLCTLQENDKIYAHGHDGIAEAIYVFGREGINSRITRYCEQCKQEVSWNNWYHEDSLPVASGHYYLVTDVQLTGQKSIPENETICLDLNGHTVTGSENARIYSLHYEGITLSVFDYSEAQTGKLVGWGETCPQGVCVWVRFGTFNLYGGTLDGSGAISNVNGVTVSVPKNAVMNMYGGTIIGGKTTYAISKNSGAAINSMGGSISVAGTLQMYGGTIKNGYATCYSKNGKYSQGYGGNVLVSGGSFTLYDGIIENGIAEGGGGNVYVTIKGSFHMKGGKLTGGQVTKKGKNGGNLVIGENCTFTMSGGSITGGVSRNYAGNIHMLGTMTMSGGTISGGKVLDLQTGKHKASNPGQNLFLVNGKLYMSGGTIKGSVSVTDSKRGDGKKPYVQLSGTAKITGAADGQSNLSLNTSNDGYAMDVKTLRKGAKIGISAQGKFTNKTSWNNAQYFVPDHPSDICQVDGCLFLGRMGCLCGVAEGGTHFGQCDGSQIPWMSWSSATSLPTGDGYYYLMQDVTCGQASIQADAHTHLDLNGKTVTLKEGSRGYATFHENTHLTITDSGSTGKMIASGETNLQGMGVWVRYGSFTLYGGTIDAANAASILSGVAVRVDKGTEFTMYGGTILGGTAKKTESGTNGTGASVQVNGTFHLYDGSIENGRAAGHGGNIAISGGGKFHMHGGRVVGGMNTEKGSSGGNVYIMSGAEMYLNGGIVCDGLTQNIGGNIYGAGLLNMSGGTVTGGLRYKVAEDGTQTTATFAGANLQLVSGSLVMSGGCIEGYATVMSYNQNTASITVSGSPRILGGENQLDLSLSTSGTDAQTPMIRIEGSLADDAMIGLTNTGFFSESTTEDNADNFVVKGDIPVTHTDGRLAAGIRYQCLCTSLTDTHKPGCDGEKMIWNAWTSGTSLPTKEGYWFLTTNVTCGQSGIAADNHVYLDLAGRTVTGNSGSRVYATFNANSHLTITDSSAKETGKLVATGTSTDQGKVVWVRYGSFTLFGGTLDASAASTTSNGAAVYLPGGCSFTMNGGQIISGTAGLGGGIYSGGTVVINGGLIQRGENATGVLIYTTGAKASLTLNGGTVDSATAAGNGLQTAAVTATSAASVILDGGTILGKPCGLYLYDAVLELKSGTIGGAYVYVNGNLNKGSTANIYGGTIENGIYVYRGTAHLEGAPVITGGYGLKLASGKTFSLGDLLEGANILLTCEDAGRIVASIVADPTDTQFILPADDTLELYYLDEQGLFLNKRTA